MELEVIEVVKAKTHVPTPVEKQGVKFLRLQKFEQKFFSFQLGEDVKDLV